MLFSTIKDRIKNFIFTNNLLFNLYIFFIAELYSSFESRFLIFFDEQNLQIKEFLCLTHINLEVANEQV